MSLKIVETENGFTVTEVEFQKKQKTWVCSNLGELASFMLGYYETGGIYTEEITLKKKIEDLVEEIKGEKL